MTVGDFAGWYDRPHDVTPVASLAEGVGSKTTSVFNGLAAKLAIPWSPETAIDRGFLALLATVGER
jgi:hypothetical protein